MSRLATGASAKIQHRTTLPEQPESHFAIKTFHLTSEETIDKWANPEGWLLSGLQISASADERVRIELWDPHASYEHPVLWHELALVPEREASIVTGCQVGEPFLAKSCVAEGPRLVPIAGCLLPVAMRPPASGFREKLWGGDPKCLDTSWIDSGSNSSKAFLSTPFMFASATWNGPRTDEVLSLSFQYPGIPPEGRSVAIHWDENQKSLAERPIPEWPNATWVWCIRRA